MKNEGRSPPPMTLSMCFAYFAVEGGADHDYVFLEVSGSNRLIYEPDNRIVVAPEEVLTEL